MLTSPDYSCVPKLEYTPAVHQDLVSILAITLLHRGIGNIKGHVMESSFLYKTQIR